MLIDLTEGGIMILQHSLGLYLAMVDMNISNIEKQNLPEGEDLTRLRENREEAEALSQIFINSLNSK